MCITRLIFGRPEHARVRSHNLIGRVAEDALRSCIPAGDDSFLIHGKDRVVLRALEDLAKMITGKTLI
jgi:hypothetical protein